MCVCGVFFYPLTSYFSLPFLLGTCKTQYECVLDVIILEMLPMSHYFLKNGSKFLSFLYFALCIFASASNESSGTLKNKGDIDIFFTEYCQSKSSCDLPRFIVSF